jgi:tetratricopeptide (TPR) repeat protein
MCDARYWMLALGMASSWIGLAGQPAAAQSRLADPPRSTERRLAEADALLRQFTTDSGVGVALGRSGAVEVTIPETGSPFARQPESQPSKRSRVEAGPSGIRVLVDPPAPLPRQAEHPRLPADVQGLLNQFAPNVRLSDGGVQFESGGVRLDTRNGVNVDLETPEGRVRISQRAIEDYSAARKLFHDRDYQRAVRLMDSALEQMPRDARFRQFRALVHFALGDHGPAADDAYHALSLGSAWDWPTVRALYGDPADYTAQYRRLQQAAQDNDSSAELMFLLAYHHTLLGHHDAALKAWNEADRLLPDDPVILDQIRQLEDRPGLERGRD